MLEARLNPAVTLKKLLDAVKDLVVDVNFDCNSTGISLQAMDSAHVALIVLLLRQTGFEHYRCDRSINLGMSLVSLGKILRSVGPDDVLTLQAEDKGDVLSLLFENSKNDRVSEYNLKLMDIDSDHLGVPDTEYDATIELSSNELKRICTDLSNLSESVTLSITKEGVQFSAEGEIGQGSVMIKNGSGGSIDEKDEADSCTITCDKPVSVVLSLKYLLNFCKASPLSPKVILGISEDIPMMIEFKVSELGYIRYGII
ncbi:proliferating cell nuclear antigen [Terramyces sp. JEL0728]|nr:proliferating cell nuclear antigen [Terramyces sp. JEL0728]